MGQPRDRAITYGRTVVYAQYADGDPWIKDDRWFLRKVELGTNQRASTATIEFDRARLLRDPSIGEPEINPDSRFMCGYQEADQVNVSIFFEGIPVNLSRVDAGAVGSQSTTGILTLKSSSDLFKQSPESQIVGAWLPRVPDPEQAVGYHVLDESFPVVFNPTNLPNRSVNQDSDAGYMDPAEARSSYYFTAPDSFDLIGSGVRERSKYWTYAQAIAWLLCYYGDSEGLVDEETTFRNTHVDFGTRDGGLDLIWDCVGPLIDQEPPDDNGAGLEAFDVTPDVLLTQKVQGVDVTGMDLIDAIGTLLTQAGCGYFLDFRAETSDIDMAPTDTAYKFRVFTPGGENVAGGKGAQFLPRLEPFNTSSEEGGVERDPADYLAANNLNHVDARYDMNEIVNHPMVRAAPKRWEVTLYLRPMWRPIEGGLDGAGAAFIDNVDPSQTMALAQYDGTITMDGVARAEMNRSLFLFKGQPSVFTEGNLVGEVARRTDFIAKALVASNEWGKQYFDVLRKWGVPTDFAWSDLEFARDPGGTIPSIPDSWKSYRPIQFGSTSGTVITTPIPGSEVWPTRRRPFLPLLGRDASGSELPPVVELSFNSGSAGSWFEWPAVNIDSEDSVLWLQFENPADVRTPRKETGVHHHLALAYVSNQLRVRITCSIEGSDNTVVVPPTLDQVSVPRARVFPAPQLRSEATVSKYQFQTVKDVDQLSDVSAATTSPDDADNKFFIFTPRDIGNALRAQANRIQALGAVPIIHGSLKIPWPELDLDLGNVVPRVEDTRIGDVISGLEEVPRNLDFTFEIRQGMRLSPSVAGIVYNFGQGDWTTDVALSDWRAIDGV